MIRFAIYRYDLAAGEVDVYYSVMQNRVLPRDSEAEAVFRLEEEQGEAAAHALVLLAREILTGRVDVTLCYCSVFEDCWSSRLQDVVRRTRGDEGAVSGGGEERAVGSCNGVPRSAI